MTSNSGTCLMNLKWKEEHVNLVNSFSSYLNVVSYRLSFLQIAPDFIFNTAGLSVANTFMTQWNSDTFVEILGRVEKIKNQFKNIYAIVTITTSEENQAYLDAYFKSCVALEKPTFIVVADVYMGFQQMLHLTLANGEIKKQNAIPIINTERQQLVRGDETCMAVLTAIPGIERHDACMLMQGIGSIDAISKASKKKILETTDLSQEKAEMLINFFRDRNYYLRPVIN